MLSEIAKKDAERFEPDRMVDSWEAYRKTLDEARENYRQELSIARENGPVPESLAFFHPDVRGNVAGDNNGFAVVEKNDGNLSTKENLKAQAPIFVRDKEKKVFQNTIFLCGIVMGLIAIAAFAGSGV